MYLFGKSNNYILTVPLLTSALYHPSFSLSLSTEDKTNARQFQFPFLQVLPVYAFGRHDCTYLWHCVKLICGAHISIVVL